MSSAVMAYTVDLDEVLGVIGSKSQAALERCEANLGSEMLSEMIESRLGEDDDEDEFTEHDLMRHLIMGEPYDPRLGFAYAYCFEHIVSVHGQFLDNRTWSAFRCGYLDQVQEALTRAGVDKEVFSITKLLCSGPPITLPPIEDFPAIGVVAKDEVATVQATLACVDIAKIEDTETRGSIESLLEWLQICRKQERALVCFWY